MNKVIVTGGAGYIGSHTCLKLIELGYEPRRTGDVAEIYSDTKKSSKYLKWKAEKSISDALKSAWNWQLNKT